MSYRLTIVDMQVMASERGGKCLSPEYLGGRGILKWQCEKGHIWEASVVSVRGMKSWCPECLKKRSVKNLKEYAQFKNPIEISATGEKLRVCNTCEIAKPHAEMVKAAERTDGIRSICKSCRRELSRAIREKKAAKAGREMIPYRERPFSNLSDEELLEHLRRFQREFGRPPSSMDLENNPNFPHAYTYYRRFKYNMKTDKAKAKGWLDILAKAGIEPLDYEKIWTAWEYLVEVACEKLRGKCLFQSSKLIEGQRPDVVIIEENVIVDAATSNYRGAHKEKQYRLATEAGYSVEYWCLYRTSENGINQPGLKYVFSEEIAEQLKQIGEETLAEDIVQLLTKYTQYAEKIMQRKSEQILTGLQLYYEKFGKSPKTKDFTNNIDLPFLYRVYKIFGSLNEALIAAGLPINRKKITPYDEKIAVEDLINVVNQLGHIPTNKEFDEMEKTYKATMYIKKFGGIRKCLIAQNIDVSNFIIKEESAYYFYETIASIDELDIYMFQ